MKFNQLEDWQMIDGYAYTRVVLGGDKNIVSDRVAVVEKTPRVRVYDMDYVLVEYRNSSINSGDIWLKGPKSSDFEDGMGWCDQMLVLLGWY